jgi:hypothetical protein
MRVFSDPLATPGRTFARFSGGDGDTDLQLAHRSDYLPETPDPAAWVGGSFGRDPTRSTREYVGRNDVLARDWPLMVREASEAPSSLLNPLTASSLVGGATPSVTRLIRSFLLGNGRYCPAIAYFHNICWQSSPYLQVHHAGTRELINPLRRKYLKFGSGTVVSLGFEEEHRVAVRPHELPWAPVFGIDPARVGFCVERLHHTRMLPGGKPCAAIMSKFFVANASKEFHPFRTAGVVPAAVDIAYALSVSAGSSVLPYVPGTSKGPCHVLDVQLIKLWRLNRSLHVANFVWYDNLTLAFRRDTGLLVYLVLGNDTLGLESNG